MNNFKNFSSFISQWDTIETEMIGYWLLGMDNYHLKTLHGNGKDCSLVAQING